MFELLAGVSFLAQVAGTIGSVSAAHQQAEAQQNITQDELKVEAQRQQAMELDARRKQMEIIRTNQRARAMALTTATSQGAATPGSSVLAGAYGQASGQSGVNMLGVNQNLEIGQNIFGLNSQISQQKIAMSQAQSSAATYSGLSSLGGSLMSSLGAAQRLGGGLGAKPSAYTGPTYLGGFNG